MSVKCMDCMDAGYRMYDGTPSACPNCDAGAAFEQAQRGAGPEATGTSMRAIPRSELNPMRLPPGGDVLITEMKRQAAGLPVGVIGSDVLVRAHVEAQPLVHELVRLLDDFTRDVPGTQERAVETLAALPEWAIPDDVANRKDAPDTEPLFDQEAEVVPLEQKPRRQPAGAAKGSTPAAPLEPPPD